ncbi:MAG: hypothetical protein JWO70_4506 [Betaproteobacteria bacterium]|nr:hypothetical protein [Betaproteobacteria bacterium]
MPCALSEAGVQGHHAAPIDPFFPARGNAVVGDTPVRRIHVVFSERDLIATAASGISGDDWVIGDIASPPATGRYFFPELDLAAQSAACSVIAQRLSGEQDRFLSGLQGFANVFYECTVMPVARYVCALRAAIRCLKGSGEPFEVVFPRQLSLAVRSSAYYMSEYELHVSSVRLYDREATFLPYLLDVCDQERASYRSRARRRISPVMLFSPLRVWSVFALRFAFALTAWRPRSRAASAATAGARSLQDVDLIVVTRAQSQTEFFAPFLRSTGTRTAIARRLGLSCVQVMQCDQFAHALPIPVFGDWFLADGRTNESRFHEAWPDAAAPESGIAS